MADGPAKLARSAVAHCLYCDHHDLMSGYEDVEDFYFGNVAGTFEFRRCRNCDSLVLVDPLVSEVLHEAYSEYYTHGSSPSASRLDIRSYLRGHYLKRRFGGENGVASGGLATLYRILASDFDAIDRIGRYAPPAPGAILDYGCGDGEFLVRMREFGHSVTGVDFDPVCVRKGLERGISVCTPDEIASDDWVERFDFISLAHVIEHVADPRELLGELFRWLKPGGTLFLETPNANAIGLEIFGHYWRGLEAPRHLSVPSEKGLLQAAREAGFALERQIVSKTLRDYLWAECLTVVPAAEQSAFREKVASADNVASGNAEFLTYLLKKSV